MMHQEGFTILELLIVLGILGILALVLASGASSVYADSGTEARIVPIREVRYVRAGELEACLEDPDLGWEYTGWEHRWNGNREYRIERNMASHALWLVEVALLNDAKMQDDGTFVVSAEAMTAFTEDIEKAARRAEKEGR